MARRSCIGVLAGIVWLNAGAVAAPSPIVVRPARVFDGVSSEVHEGWIVLICGERIEAAGTAGEVRVPDGARVIELPGTTLLPGLIDAHTHVLLHPYNEATWNDQVLKEALALRVCQATNHFPGGADTDRRDRTIKRRSGRGTRLVTRGDEARG